MPFPNIFHFWQSIINIILFLFHLTFTTLYCTFKYKSFIKTFSIASWSGKDDPEQEFFLWRDWHLSLCRLVRTPPWLQMVWEK